MQHGDQWAGLKFFSVRNCVMPALAVLMVFSAGRVEGFAEAAPAADGAEQADSWRFNVAAYLWGLSVQGKARAGDDIDVSFSDILDKLKLAGMGLASARKGRLMDPDVFGIPLPFDLSGSDGVWNGITGFD